VFEPNSLAIYRNKDLTMEGCWLARTQIIQQAATAMLAQANQQPSMVMSLLR